MAVVPSRWWTGPVDPSISKFRRGELLKIGSWVFFGEPRPLVVEAWAAGALAVHFVDGSPKHVGGPRALVAGVTWFICGCPWAETALVVLPLHFASWNRAVPLAIYLARRGNFGAEVAR